MMYSFYGLRDSRWNILFLDLHLVTLIQRDQTSVLTNQYLPLIVRIITIGVGIIFLVRWRIPAHLFFFFFINEGVLGFHMLL